MEIFDAASKRMWREYCAVVQLPMEQFLAIQNTLLSEQMDLVSKSSWVKMLPGGRAPSGIGEFRRTVPLRRWADYAPVLHPDGLDGLGGDVHCWVQTSWCHGSWKRVPWTRRFFDAQCRHAIGALMLSVARHDGDVRLNKNFQVLPILPETPFASAWLATGIIQRGVVGHDLVPSQEDGGLTMAKRVRAGLFRSMETGLDCIVGMTSTLLMARREFERMVAGADFRRLLSEAGSRAALKWTIGAARQFATGQTWEPKSMLAPKSVITWGADTGFLAPALEAQWGAPVFQLYASSEGGIMAMQDWQRNELIPLPTSVFLEFLPSGSPPDNEAPLLLDALEEGKLYEPVITSFYGMPFLRLRQGDLLQVTGRNQQGVPLFRFHSRADDIIDLGSIARIDRATLAEAMEMVGFKDGEWLAKKEYLDGRPLMGLHVNVAPDALKELGHKVHRALGKVDPHYREACYTLGYSPIQVSAMEIAVPAAPGSYR